MRTFRTLLAALLCAALLLSLLSGCGEPGPTEPTQAASEETTEPTQPPVDYAKVYADAAQPLETADALTVTASVVEERTVGNDTLTEELTSTVRYQDRDSDSPVIHRSDLILYGSFRASYEQLWANGVLYAKVKQARYYSREPLESFLEGQIPASPLDPAHYTQIAGDETKLVFSGAADAESWAMPADGALLFAQAEATLADGVLAAVRYEIRFLFGGTEIHTVYEITLTPSVDEDLSALVPNSTKEYESLDSVEAALLLMRGRIALEHATVLTTETVGTLYSEATALLMLYTEENSAYGEGEDFLNHEEDRYMWMDYANNQAGSYTARYDYSDGELHWQFDEDEPGSKELTPTYMQESLQEERLYLVPNYSDLVDAKVYDVGDYYLIEFRLNEDFAAKLQAKANGVLFGEWDYLDRYATSYSLKTAEGYLALEKYSYLPTSLSLDYEGVHIIQGTPLSLSMNLTTGIKLYDPDTYEAITDEPLPDEPPETPATPLLYEVTGGNGERMYLFGTIHVGDDRTAFLPQEIYDAFDESNALAVEFDSAAFTESLMEDEELQTQVTASYCYTDGTEISNHIDSELYEAAVIFLKVAGEYTAQANRYKPFVWSNLIDNFYLSQGRRLTSSKGMDNRLLARAREQDKEILSVESGEFQLELLSGYSDALQELLLLQSISGTRNETLANTYALYELWCAGDEAALIERLAAMSEDERELVDADALALYDEYHQQMEVDRNAAMVEVAEEYLSSGKTVFFAVGLAHLLGEGGLVQALRDAGYTVTLIHYADTTP